MHLKGLLHGMGYFPHSGTCSHAPIDVWAMGRVVAARVRDDDEVLLHDFHRTFPWSPAWRRMLPKSFLSTSSPGFPLMVTRPFLVGCLNLHVPDLGYPSLDEQCLALVLLISSNFIGNVGPDDGGGSHRVRLLHLSCAGLFLLAGVAHGISRRTARGFRRRRAQTDGQRRVASLPPAPAGMPPRLRHRPARLLVSSPGPRSCPGRPDDLPGSRPCSPTRADKRMRRGMPRAPRSRQGRLGASPSAGRQEGSQRPCAVSWRARVSWMRRRYASNASISWVEKPS